MTSSECRNTAHGQCTLRDCTCPCHRPAAAPEKPRPVLNEAGALICPQDAEGRYLEAEYTSPVFEVAPPVSQLDDEIHAPLTVPRDPSTLARLHMEAVRQEAEEMAAHPAGSIGEASGEPDLSPHPDTSDASRCAALLAEGAALRRQLAEVQGRVYRLEGAAHRHLSLLAVQVPGTLPASVEESAQRLYEVVYGRPVPEASTPEEEPTDA